MAAIADRVPDGSRVADVGTDHALLPIHLIRSGRAARVIASDNKAAPLEKAFDAIRARMAKLPSGRKASVAELEAARLVPTRGKLGFPFSLSAVPLEERRPVFISHNVWAFFDGKRTLLDCIRMSDAEKCAPSSEKVIARTVQELKRLEKYGYVSLRRA